MNRKPDPPSLTMRAIRCVGVEVPMTYALGTSRGTITKAPLLLIDLDTEEGVTGHSYLWCYFPAAIPAIANILEEVERVVKGERVAPADLWSKLTERFALIGVQGIVRMAMSGFDVAAWDALADRRGLAARDPDRQRAKAHSRLQFLRPRPDAGGQGGRRGGKAPRRRLPRAQAQARLSDAARTISPRCVPSRSASAARSRSWSITIRRSAWRRRSNVAARSIRKASIGWRNRSATTTMPAMRRSCANSRRRSRSERISPKARPWRWRSRPQAADYVMPDLERIGGVTGWLRAAALAAAHRIEMSSHLFPEASAHLLAATPTCHFLEYVDWADKIVEEPLQIVDGFAVVPQRRAPGVTWNSQGGGEVSDRRDPRRAVKSSPSPPAASSRVNGAARLALARLLIGVERLVERRQVFHQVLDLHFDAVNQRLAFEAIPFERIELVRPRRFDHQADRAFLRPLRRVGHMRAAGGRPRPRGSGTS